MTLTLVGNQGERPQPVNTSTPDDSVNLENIHQDVYGLLQSLQTLAEDIESGRFAEQTDMASEIPIPQTPKEKLSYCINDI